MLIAWMFYDLWQMAFVMFLPVAVLNGKRFRMKQQRLKEERFITEYKELLRNLITGLETGYSVENAFLEAERQHKHLFETHSVLLREIHAINGAVALRVPIEKAFRAFAERYPYEEVVSFASIFSFGKRLGGNYIANLRTTARKLEEKMDLKQEIAAMFAEKQLELSVMSVMPLAIIAYMKLGSPTFLAPMYKNPMGMLIMTCSIGIYVAALIIGRRIISIEV